MTQTNQQQDKQAMFGGPLSYAQFRKLYPATRNFHHYDHNQQADLRASHRQGHRQRLATGHYFYTHDLLVGICFRAAGQATTRAYEIYLTQFADENATVAA